eukprot:gene4176-5275_t
MAEKMGLPRPVSVQNPYNLLVRKDTEGGMVEAVSPRNLNVSFLAYSPLAGGALTGKYLNPKKIKDTYRMRRYVGYMHRYISPPAMAATKRYQEIADSLVVPLTPMALAWVYSRPFVTSTVIGATDLEQLDDNVHSLNMLLSEEALSLINEAYKLHLDPTKGSFPVVDPYLDDMDPSMLPWGARDID